MAKAKLICTTPHGTFTRQSDRPYLFCIVTLSYRDPGYVAKQANGRFWQEMDNLKFLTGLYLTKYAPKDSQAERDSHAARAVELEGMKAAGVGAFVDANLAANEAKRVAGNVAEVNWSMSAKAADAASRKWLKYGYITTHIYPVDGK